jgi:hypothetical protein
MNSVTDFTTFFDRYSTDPLITAFVMVAFVVFLAAMAIELCETPARPKR